MCRSFIEMLANEMIFLSFGLSAVFSSWINDNVFRWRASRNDDAPESHQILRCHSSVYITITDNDGPKYIFYK